MRRVRFGFVAAVLACACASAAATQACKTPSQVELDVGIANTTCGKDLQTTAITVGVDPHTTEGSLAGGYITATTSNCEGMTPSSNPEGWMGHVGTLVVTPSDDSSNASIIVTAGVGGKDSSACKPPSYSQCIVARRRFTFVEHQKLTLPITLDFSCVDVPCDERSTCAHGQCVSSDVTPQGDSFGDPSIPYDAGAGNGNDSGGTDGGGTDGGTKDSGGDGATPTFPSCQGTTLHCADGKTGLDTTCNGASTPCCDSASGVATCGGACAQQDNGWCCSDGDCKSPGFICSRPTSTGPAGKCVGQTSCQAGPTLYCNGFTCSAGQACCEPVGMPGTTTCTTPADCTTAPSCCTGTDCAGLGTCPPPSSAAPQTCQGSALPPGPPSCSGTTLTCDGRTCDAPSACCVPSDGGAAVCLDAGSCSMGEAQDCCQSGTQCPSGKMCGLAVVGHDGGVAMMNLLPPAPLGAGVVGGGGLVSTCQ